MHGRKQQTAIPMRHAAVTQITTIATSKARNVIQSLQNTTCVMVTQLQGRNMGQMRKAKDFIDNIYYSKM